MAGSSTQRSKGRKREPAGVSLSLAARAKLFDPIRASHRIYRLESGRVRLSSDGEAILDHLTPGDFFGEKCLLRARPQEQAATALSPVKMTCFRRSELLDCVQRDRRLALRLLMNLAARIDRYEKALRDFVVEPAEVRLAQVLSRLTSLRQASGWVRLPLTLSNLEFAKMIGTTRWRVSHFLHHFQQLGWLRFDRGMCVKREGLTGYLLQARQQRRKLGSIESLAEPRRA